MRTTSKTVWAVIPLLLGLTLPTDALGQDEAEMAPEADGRSPALTHIHHVSVTFRGTPEERGLLPTAVAEAEIAAQHASLATRTPEDLEAMQRHAGHVLHALDPSEVESGPGLGYGAIYAAERTAHYISLAARSAGATPPIETHAEHIETSARNAAVNGTAAAELAQEILDAEEAQVAAELLQELVERTQAMLEGVDADGDGRIGWQEGEGGLAQATTHLGLLRRAAGLEGP
ncbi:MAG: hypothetical protein R3253_13690 [Longimicrobiales bacterium]|nr:hypothetical protein [Longimicrobiales bacterium]